MLNSYLKDPERRKREVIPGTFDIVFKRIFTSQKEYLADIINYVTKISREDVINNSIIVNSEHIVENIEQRKKTSDLIIEINENVINLEMNRKYYERLNRRNNEYMYRIASLSYKDKNIIQINFDNFNKQEKIIEKYIMMEETTKKIDSESIEKYKINLALIYNKYYNKEKLSRFEKEILMLMIKDRKELKELSKGDKIMEELNKEINDISDDKYVSLLYDREERDKEMYECLIKEAKEEGIEAGLKEGIETGLKEGKINTAKNMLDLNIDIDIISKSTGLSKQDIKNIE